MHWLEQPYTKASSRGLESTELDSSSFTLYYYAYMSIRIMQRKIESGKNLRRMQGFIQRELPLLRHLGMSSKPSGQ